MAKANLKAFGDTVLKHVRAGVRSGAGLVEEKLKQNVGLTDHSQEDLDALGNPYAKRHYQQIHDPAELVHTQSGKLRNSITVRKEGEDSYAIGADEGLTDERGVHYVIDVIEGNSLMVARDYPSLTMQQIEEEKVLENTIEKSIEGALNKF